MYLKSIKAYGFKSFADKTEINFGENINGIVGPNGSGKSNVVDAVRWVLGEQSLKSLRGDVSTDVIFSGSKSRKALNSASVTLVFDNSDLYLPINYTEVSIKRVMYRSGENEYFLNNERCRLKDITNILADSGADKESFNIISQGKIDEILSTKPGDRRVVFESAAGVIKYKKRKEEAIRKLDRVNTNMVRVLDILRELESNLGPLERQSRDATTFLGLKDELSDLEISLMTHDINFYNYKTKEIRTEIDALNDEVIKLSNSHSSYDIELMGKKDQIKKIEDAISDNQSTLIEVTRSIEKIDADIRILRERKKYTDEYKDEHVENMLVVKESLMKLETSINEINNEIEVKNEELNNKREFYEEKNRKYQEILNSKNNCIKLVEKRSMEETDLKYKIDYLVNSIDNGNNIPKSVRSIMANVRLDGIHDVIGKIIKYDSEYGVAVNTSLGGACNYLVVDTSNTAKELVRYLKENKLGRATFYPIDTIRPRYIRDEVISDIKNIDGYIGVASELVFCDDIYRNIIDNQLGNVVVARDIDVANKLSKRIEHKYKIVTLDGQVINVGGSVTGGSVIEGNSVLRDKYELDNKRLEYDRVVNSKRELIERIDDLNKELLIFDKEMISLKSEINEILEFIVLKDKYLGDTKDEYEVKLRELKDLEALANDDSNNELESMLNMYYGATQNRDNIKKMLDDLRSKRELLEASVVEIESMIKQDSYYISSKEKLIKELEIKLNTMNIKLDNLLISLGEEYNMTYDNAITKYKLEIDEEVARGRVRELKVKIKELGYVNVDAIEEYKGVKERYEFLNTQRDDLKQAEDALLEIIKEMDGVMKNKFLSTFEAIRQEFKKVFVSMFHGGEAELILTDPDNLLETGIEIQAVPTGKNLKSISLLSGGEKTFTAISLLFAILNVRAVPFCLLDEVEAALDDANVESFGNYLNKYKNKTQFILITHKKKTMEFADILYGITMQESGVSKLVSVKLEDIEA